MSALDIEVYVLCEERSFDKAMHFLATFAQDRRRRVDGYEVPQFADDPLRIFDNDEELLRALGDDREPYSIYWDVSPPGGEAGAASVHQAMLFFNADGSMVAGLVTEPAHVHSVFARLIDCIGASFGYIDRYMPPPASRADFVALCRSADVPRLVDGLLLSDRAANDAL